MRPMRQMPTFVRLTGNRATAGIVLSSRLASDMGSVLGAVADRGRRDTRHELVEREVT